MNDSRKMRGRIAVSVACLGTLLALPGPAQAAPVPVDDITAVHTALRSAAMPISTRTAESIATTIERAASGTPRYNYFPRSVHLVEGRAQPFLYDTTAAGCLPPGFGEDNDSVGIAQAIAGPAVDTNLPVPAIAPGQVNVFFSAMNTAMSSPRQADHLEVAWLNLNTMQSGRAPMFQERPADYIVTLSNTLQTGTGTVVFVVFGSVLDNTSWGLPPCDFAPVVGVVRA
ncbi:Rv1157c family protein [Rhodococcus sp. NPDC055112]